MKVPAYLLGPVTVLALVAGNLSPDVLTVQAAIPTVVKKDLKKDLTAGQTTQWESLLSGAMCNLMNTELGIDDCTIDDFKWLSNKITWMVDDTETGEGHWQLESPVKRPGNTVVGVVQ